MSSTFFTLADGRTAELFTLKGKNGLIAQISNFGGDIVTLLVPDKNGRLTDVALGFACAKQYDGPGPYFGAMVGRCANRIGGAAFPLDGKIVKVLANEGRNSLHGGSSFAYRLWDVVVCSENRLELKLESPDGDAGFPGNLTVRVSYEVRDDNTLQIDMHAVTDKATIVNLTNHCYFNLTGEGSGPILDHDVAVYADAYQEIGEGLIPTGRLIDVAGTGFDLRKFTDFSEALKSVPAGYDHSFIIQGKAGELRPFASARSRRSGIQLDVFGTDYAVQFYSGSALKGGTEGKFGYYYPNFAGFCFETQNYVDAQNHPEFPSPVLRPGEEYHQTIQYRFSIVK